MTTKSSEHHRVLIIGGGPAGLFAARELAVRGERDVVLLDSGSEVMDRDCPLTEACNCTPCDILEGLGGSGGVSDGKLTFSLDRGTQMEPIFAEEHGELLDYIERYVEDAGIVGHRYEPTVGSAFTGGRIEFTTYPLWHVGSDGIRTLSEVLTDDVRSHGVDLRSRTRALKLLHGDHGFRGAEVRSRRGYTYETSEITADHVIIAVGIFGMGWLEQELLRAGFAFTTGPAGIGLRIETPTATLQPLFDTFYDWKAVGTFNGVTMRSFCCNRDGYIMPEYHKHLNIRNVNGHSYLDPSLKSGRSNFSLQAKITEGNHADPQAFVRAVAKGLNDLSGGWQVRQTVADFLNRSLHERDLRWDPTYPQARIRDIAGALPAGLYDAFRQYLIELDLHAPGLLRSGWVYGPEIKYHARKLPVHRHNWALKGMEDTYVVGDSTGLTGSYVSAAMTGLIAARGIASRH